MAWRNPSLDFLKRIDKRKEKGAAPRLRPAGILSYLQGEENDLAIQPVRRAEVKDSRRCHPRLAAMLRIGFKQFGPP
jgi:hypothetical protein